MPTKDKAYYICVYEDQPHIKDSTLVKCSKCPKKLWISNHNLDKNPLCAGCAIKMAESLPQGEKLHMGVRKEDAERAAKEIIRIQENRRRIYEACVSFNPNWKNLEVTIKEVIDMADKHGDGMKRVTVSNGKTYLVPIEDIICYGLKEEEVSKKYKEGK